MKINTFLIGAQKAGTTSVYSWLGQHPNVCAPASAKDYHYFSDDEKIKMDISLLHDFYNEIDNEQIVLTAAVNYMFIPETVERIYNYNPKAKIIAILREPIKRAIS
ncbi:MAG: sulfotransferase domain-containing protein, partial [Bacteroidota bacterium]